MSLKINNDATEKQLNWLREHEYYGKMNLTKSEAEQLITELMEQERIERRKNEYEYFERFKRING